jgi:nicotinate (nicotinamide) nucleotide adenylyltransferase
VRRILLFGSSANPPTGAGGHLGLVRWAARRDAQPELGGPLDAIWVLPVYRHVYPEKAELAPFEDRVRMCELTFEGEGGPVPVEVSRVEAEAAGASGPEGPPHGTLDVIEQLEARHPDARFGLLLGADTAEDLRAGRWRRSAELLARVPLVVAPRRGAASAPGEAADAPRLEPVSSSAARAAAADPARLRELVTPQVAAYIEDRGLYGAGHRSR